MIFKSCLKQGILPAEWKKANVVAVLKEGDHQFVKSYRPVSLLPVFHKIFERLMFKHFLDNNLISFNQSSFKPVDSCINQLIAVAHDNF